MIYSQLLRAVCAFSVITGVLGGLNVTSPNSGTTLSAGVVSRVTWVDNGKAPTLKEFGPARISLCTGTAEKQSVVQVLAASVDVSEKSNAEFTVDAKVGPNSDTYLIRFDSLGSKDVAFSQNFKLTKMTGTFSTTTSPSSSGSGSKSSTPSGSTKSSSATATGSDASITPTGTDTLTAPPPIFTGTGIIGNATDGLNGTITASDGNVTATLPAPCVGCVNITVVVLVTTAHDSPAPSPTSSDALSIANGLSLGRLSALLAALVIPFALWA